jgi:hypothetical protein
MTSRLPPYIVETAYTLYDYAYSGREYIPVTGKNIREHVPKWFREACRKSYYGGRFEVFFHGTFHGTAYEYDINSAYPKIMSQLPCPFHGQYVQGKGRPDNARKLAVEPGFGIERGQTLCLALVTVEGSHLRIGTLPHRLKDGGIIFPYVTKGWYWLHEIEAAQRAGCIDNIVWHEWAAYIPCDCPPPLAWIERLYLDRIALGEAGKNSPNGVAKKLGYNSIYGKMAQSVGDPKYGNPIYASLITMPLRPIPTALMRFLISRLTGSISLLVIRTSI